MWRLRHRFTRSRLSLGTPPWKGQSLPKYVIEREVPDAGKSSVEDLRSAAQNVGSHSRFRGTSGVKPTADSVKLELAGLFKHPLKKKARVLENSVVAPVLPDYGGVALMVREHDHGC